MIKVSVQTDISRALDKLAYIRSEVADKAVVRSLNKVCAQAKTQASREIRDAGYKIKAAEIKKALEAIKASSSRKTAVLRAIGRPLNLIYFDARPVKNGVTVSVKNGRKLIPGAFIATYKGKLGVYERKPGPGFRRKYVDMHGKPNWSQLPIKNCWGPSIPTAFISDAVQGALVKLIQEKFPDILKHEIEFLKLK